MGDPSPAVPATRRWKPASRRHLIAMASILFGVPFILWMGTGFLIARSLRYPEFLRIGGQDVFGQRVPQFARGSLTDVGTALGVEPERLDCGVVAVYSANNPSYGINWGMLKRKFALATARTLMDDGFTKIAALGISEGAAGAIMAQAEQPVFTAIVADSSYANLEQLFMRSPSMSRLNPAFLGTVMWEAQFWFGRKLDKIAPVIDAGNLGACSLLIIQNRGDQVTPPADGQALLAAAGFNAQIWTAPSEGHGDAIYEDPKGYAARVLRFLDASFAPDGTSAA